MNMGRLLLAMVLLGGVSIWTGCASSSSGGSGGGSGSTGGDGGTLTDDDGTDSEGGQAGEDGGVDPDASTDGPDSDTDGDDGEDVELTGEQAQALDQAINSLDALAGVFAGVGSIDSDDGDGGPIVIGGQSGCPQVSISQGSITADFGEGCSPALYPELTFSGSITGQLDLSEGTLSLTFQDYAIDDTTIDGTMTGSVSLDGQTLAFEADLDARFTSDLDSYSVSGSVVVQVNLTTGEVLIVSGDLTFNEGTANAYTVSLSNVHMAPENGFVPDSGTITLDVDGVVMQVTFTSQTPINGEVLLSINGSPTVSVSLDDL